MPFIAEKVKYRSASAFTGSGVIFYNIIELYMLTSRSCKLVEVLILISTTTTVLVCDSNWARGTTLATPSQRLRLSCQFQ